MKILLHFMDAVLKMGRCTLFCSSLTREIFAIFCEGIVFRLIILLDVLRSKTEI